MDKVRVLLVAIGGYGNNYIKELTEKDVPSAKIEGIVEIMPGIEEMFPVIRERKLPVYPSLEEFYREHEADLAVISTPMQLHFPQAKYCLEHGSNVLLEKPVCTNLEDARRLIQLQKDTGHFVAIGYQMVYSRDLLQLKRDILAGKYGKPLYLKAMQGVRRGDKYYARNNWAGKINVKGYAVNDSPFSNASAHQFQNMVFVLGKTLDTSTGIGDIRGELYRANRAVENFDTCALCATTEEGIPLYYYTTH